MAIVSRCDICGQEKPTNRVEVSVNIMGAVRGAVSTGTTLNMDACEDCWFSAAALISDRVRERLQRDIPIHREIYVVYNQMEPVRSRLKNLQVALAALPTNPAELVGDVLTTKRELEAKIRAASAELQVLEDKRMELVRSAD